MMLKHRHDRRLPLAEVLRRDHRDPIDVFPVVPGELEGALELLDDTKVLDRLESQIVLSL